MKTHRFSIGIISALLAASLVTSARADPSPPGRSAPDTAVSTAFTYRGQLKSGSAPINATCNIAFRLFDAGSGGVQVGGTLTQTVAVTASLFTVDLNFGPSAFAGSARWLDLAVRCPAGAGAFTALSPRQEVTAVPNALFASNADLLDGLDSTAFVDLASTQNISGVKTFAGGVKFPDGTKLTSAPYLAVLPGPGGAAIVDGLGTPATAGSTVNNVGGYTSLAIGVDGLGLISYHDWTSNNMRVLHCGNPACSGGNSATRADNLSDGLFTSIAIGADGHGMIWDGDGTTGLLYTRRCRDEQCGETYFSNSGITGSDPFVTLGADGLGLVSFYDQSEGDLRVLHCNHVSCLNISPGYTVTTLDSAGDVGRFSSITIGADGLGLISYFDGTGANLKVAHCGNTACSISNTITTLDNTGQPGSDTSITIGSDGLGLISYYDRTHGDLRVLHCGNSACSSGNTATTVDDVGDVGTNSSIAIGVDGLATISYYDETNHDLKALHCGNSLCNSANITLTLDGHDQILNTGWVGYYTSIALGADGRMLISYYDYSTGRLKVFHCASVTCAPYTRVGR